MNRIPFGEGGCEKTRKYLDAYVSNELLVETNEQVIRHLEGCPACNAEVEAQTQLRTRLRAAVRSQSLPPELSVRIRRQIRAARGKTWFQAGWVRWTLAVAACLLVVAGIGLRNPYETRPALTDRAAQRTYIQRVSASLAAVLGIGLGDHIHCSIFRDYPRNPPPVEQMEEKLGPEYRGLLPLVRTALPGYRVVMAHQCSYAGRNFTHLTLQKDGELLSLVIARKNDGESLAGLTAASDAGGVQVFQAGADRYRVAAFEAGNFLAYVVSELKDGVNLQIAKDLAPGVHEFLKRIA
jgi:anti-sigma factor (TIGR02949 family)